MELIKQGAEAKLYKAHFFGKETVIKERFKKTYRNPALDEKLTHRRTLQEVRCMTRCRKLGIRTPVIYFIDLYSHSIYMEHVENSSTARDFINGELASELGKSKLQKLSENIGIVLAKMHSNDVIHGDLTTSNILIKNGDETVSPIMIDFGLSYVSSLAEDKGVDLYVLERAILSTHPRAENLFDLILSSYVNNLNQKLRKEVIKKLEEVRLRGRKRLMVG